MATPVERGTRVAAGADLVRIAPAEAEAQAAEAEANVAQIEARLGLGGGAATFDVDRVPEVANARANLTWRRATSTARRCCTRRSSCRRPSSTSGRRRPKWRGASSRSPATAPTQQCQALLGARARVSLARKALADTVVRAPFAGVVAERLVSVGDYVTRGTKVASVMRINPLRVELTVPAAVQRRGERRAARSRSRWTPSPGKTLHRAGALRVARRCRPTRAR